MTDVVEIVARAIDPDTFARPRIDLYRADYDLAFAKAGAIVAALRAEGFKVLAREPDLAMSDMGEYVNSEHLNDNAPLGQRRYRIPAIAVWQRMWDAAPRHGGEG